MLGRDSKIIKVGSVFQMLRQATDRPLLLVLGFIARSIINYMPSFISGVRRSPDDDVSVTEWFKRFVGSTEPLERVFSAVLHGTTGSHPDIMSMREYQYIAYRNLYHKRPKSVKRRTSREQVAVRPQDIDLLYAMERSLGDISKQLDANSRQAHYAIVGGLQALTDHLANLLQTQPNTELRKSEPVIEIRHLPSSGQVSTTSRSTASGKFSTREHDLVISAIAAERLVEIVLPSSLPSLESCRSTTIQTVNLWYPPQETPLVSPNSLGYLIPLSTSRRDNPHRALGVLFDHNVMPSVAGEPSGTKLFVLMGGHYYDSELSPPASDAEAIQQARETVSRHLDIPLSLEPGAAMATLATGCIPQLNVGHAKRMAAAHEELLATFSGQLHVAGPSYGGSGVLGSIRAGWDAARRVTNRTRGLVDGFRDDTGLARFAQQQRDGLYLDEFVPRSFRAKFRPAPTPRESRASQTKAEKR